MNVHFRIFYIFLNIKIESNCIVLGHLTYIFLPGAGLLAIIHKLVDSFNSQVEHLKYLQ